MCVSECESLCLGCAEWDKGSCLVFVLKAAACPPPRWLHFLLFSYLSRVFGTYRGRDLLDFPTAFIPPLPQTHTHTPLHPHFRGDYLNGCSTCLFFPVHEKNTDEHCFCLGVPFRNCTLCTCVSWWQKSGWQKRWCKCARVRNEDKNMLAHSVSAAAPLANSGSFIYSWLFNPTSLARFLLCFYFFSLMWHHYLLI